MIQPIHDLNNQDPITLAADHLKTVAQQELKWTWKKVGVVALAILTGILPGLLFLYYQTRRFENALILIYTSQDEQENKKDIATANSALRWGANYMLREQIPWSSSYIPFYQKLAKYGGTDIIKLFISNTVANQSDKINPPLDGIAEFMLIVRDDMNTENMQSIIPLNIVSKTCSHLHKSFYKNGGEAVLISTMFCKTFSNEYPANKFHIILDPFFQKELECLPNLNIYEDTRASLDQQGPLRKGTFNEKTKTIDWK